ncbi:hypothetical protein [Arsukibacterium sp.]|uniref:hypothetical protein n=1 Tax=Arsukibacterium sp. TaxID=1977258 RepID=UPI001BD4EE21|nr:hypothetical protein [Arsukibacterium sp.]
MTVELTKAKSATNSSALALVLYPFQFESVNEDFNWSDNHQRKLLNLYDVNKLKIISEHINCYFLVKDIDLSGLLPSMNASVAQKELLLKYISNGIKKIIDTV